jgi:hypothetical protein
MLEFSLQPDVKNAYLEHGTRRTLVGISGEGWCTPRIATLLQKTKDCLFKGLAKRTTTTEHFPAPLRRTICDEQAVGILNAWADGTREMVLSARKQVDEVLCGQVDQCFEQAEWLELMDADGGRFANGEKVEWVMKSVKRDLTEGNTAMVYQVGRFLLSLCLASLNWVPRSLLCLLSSSNHILLSLARCCFRARRISVCRWNRCAWTC